MRHGIYYWKCDAPSSDEAKRRTYFQDKYDQADLPELICNACADVFGRAPTEVAALRGDGNHLVFRVHHAGRDYLFRADDGTGEDDYMLAESHLMTLAGSAGLPVPEVIHTDVSRARCPLRFQLTAYVTEPNLNRHHQSGQLNLETVPFQLGAYLQNLHAIALPGFGFMDTRHLAVTGELRGLQKAYPDYFDTCLDSHLGYLRDHDLLSPGNTDEAAAIFARQASRLHRLQGVLVHRDMALWNILGTPGEITAIVDWDDAVSGDPADDLGILNCFYDDAFMARVQAGYGSEAEAPDFVARVHLHFLRNMLWKTKIRHSLGYFERDAGFFLNSPGGGQSLADVTRRKLAQALDLCRRLPTP